MKRLPLLFLSVCALGLAGCATKYTEPTSGDRARLRVARTGARVNTNVWSVPDAGRTCLPKGLPQGESIALLDWDNPFHTERRGVSIGIPGSDGYKSERFAEAYIPANRMFILDVAAGGGNVYRYYGCSTIATWKPVADEDYEAVFEYGAGGCRMTLTTVSQDRDGAIVKTPVAANALKRCEK